MFEHWVSTARGNTEMTAREQLRQTGAEIRHALGFADSSGREVSPGWGDLMDEMVFGRVWARPGLSLEDRMLATLSALTSKQYLDQLAGYIGGGLHIGMSPRLIQEVMLHCAMYTGFPSAESSLRVVQTVLDEKGVAAPEIDLTELDLDALLTQGQQTMETLHGGRAEDGYAAPTSAASRLYATAIDYLYGEIWNRPDISTRQRMICSVAAFTALQLTSQQRKFFPSALNIGLSKEEVFETIAQTGPYSGFPPAFNALAVAEEILP